MFSLGQFQLGKVRKVRKYSENSLCSVWLVNNANCFHKGKQRVFSLLRPETHTELYTLARWFNLSRQIPQRIASRLVTDACQTICQNYFPDTHLLKLHNEGVNDCCHLAPCCCKNLALPDSTFFRSQTVALGVYGDI